MAHGTIARVIQEKSFGFINPIGNTARENQVFFHRTALRGSVRFEALKEGQAVDYELDQQSHKGPRAASVSAA